jgi:putative FmdB family regulatory protein
MPRYTYRCEQCEDIFEVVHSMKEHLTDCAHCNETETLVRIPAITFIKSNEPFAPSGQKVGALVEQHIREAKEELSKEKTELRTTDYKEQT